MNTIDTQFGELRSLLQSPTPSSTALRDAMLQGLRTNADVFTSSWVPYIASFELPELHIDTYEDARGLLPLLPHNTTCTLSINDNALTDADVIALLKSVEPYPGIRTIEFDSSNIGDASARAIALAPNLKRLETFNFERTKLGIDAILDVWGAETLPELRTLDLGTMGRHLGLDELRQFLKLPLPQLSKLHTFKWWSTYFGTEGAQLVAQHTGLSDLRTLWFSANSIRNEGMHALTTSPYMRNIQDLLLNNNYISTSGALEFSRTSCLQQLQELHIGSNSLFDEGAIAIIESPHCTTLTALDLCQCEISRDTFSALAQSSIYDQLTTLDISANDLKDEDVLPLFQGNTSAPLEYIHLTENQLTGRTLDALSNTTHALRTLIFAECQVGDDGVFAMINSGSFRELECLDLCLNQITDAGAIALAQWPQLASLKELTLYQNKIGEAGEAALRQSPYLHDGLDLHL